MASARRNKPEQLAALEDFTNALGRQFQVRDDYMNLVSGEVSCLAPPPPPLRKKKSLKCDRELRAFPRRSTPT